jgi:hypothetical protein
MKQLKILGLLMVAATALTAFFGASTASATFTSLCKMKITDGNGTPLCPANQTYTPKDPIHAVLEPGAKLVLETGIGKVECTESTISGKLQAATAMPLTIVMEAFTSFKCGEYTVAVMPTALTVHIIDLPVFTHNGTLTLEAQVVVLKGEAECVYTTGHAGVLTGNAPAATIDFASVLTKVGGNAKCPAGNGKITGNYVTTTAMWVSE